MTTPAARLHVILARAIPERRLFVRSGDRVRFVRLTPSGQLVAWTGGALFIAWALVVTALVMVDSIGAVSIRDRAERDQLAFEGRLTALSGERDHRAAEAVATQEQFAAALEQVSAMQSQLLAAEARRRELEVGMEAAQGTLDRAAAERDAAREHALATAGEDARKADLVPLAATIDLMTTALAETAAERDAVSAEAEAAVQVADDLDLELRLMEERQGEILAQVEDALAVSVEPLDEAFRAAGLDPAKLVEEARRSHAGEAALVPMQVSTMGTADPGDPTLRANRILDRLDEINSYRIALEHVPLAMPVRDAFRYTSPFGPRWGRMHEGVDMAGPVGTPIYATADGVVSFAGWQNGYGRIVKIQHEFGIETRYPHLSAIGVEVGQQVARGDQVGDMGSSGRSTGSHLHYEVRVDGEAIDPMTYIRAGRDLL